jgi:hypothetical protein
MRINAHLYRKADDYRAEPCEIEKIIEVSRAEFAELYRCPLRDYDFIKENKEGLTCDESGVSHCLLVLGEGSDDGVLLCSEGYDYARYSTHIPNARQIVAQELRPKCVADLEKRLTDACDEVVSCAKAYDGEGPYRVLISDLQETHGLDEAYAPLLLAALGERAEAFEFEDIGDEIIIYRQEEKQEQGGPYPSPSPLPFTPERMGQLLDKALDWIGGQEMGGALYNILAEEIQMSDAEITAAGFDALEECFEEPGEDEDTGMTMQ